MRIRTILLSLSCIGLLVLAVACGTDELQSPTPDTELHAHAPEVGVEAATIEASYDALSVNTRYWKTLGRDFQEGETALVLHPTKKATEWDVEATTLSTEEVVASGRFVETSRVPIDDGRTDDPVENQAHVVSGFLQTDTFQSQVVGISIDIISPCGEVVAALALINTYEAADAAKQASYDLAWSVQRSGPVSPASIVLGKGNAQTAPLHQGSGLSELDAGGASSGGSVLCFCNQCYLDCIDDQCPPESYEEARQQCRDAYDVCMDGARTVYDTCLGSCAGNCDCNLGCAARCLACAITFGSQKAMCLSVLTGCLAGVDLAETACLSGCYLGSQSWFPNPPGCPTGWTQQF